MGAADQIAAVLGERWVEPAPEMGKVRLWFRKAAGEATIVTCGARSSIWLYQPIGSFPFLVVGLHLPSKQNRSDVDQQEDAKQIRLQIEKYECEYSNTRTVVVGDFNMMPFELGMAGSEGFHGIMSRAIAQRKSRTLYSESRSFFYNPMWGRLGDTSLGPPGSWTGAPNQHVLWHYWYLFDQVLVRPDLIPNLQIDTVRVVDEIEQTSLIGKTGLVSQAEDHPDHLPLTFFLKMEQEK